MLLVSVVLFLMFISNHLLTLNHNTVWNFLGGGRDGNLLHNLYVQQGTCLGEVKKPKHLVNFIVRKLLKLANARPDYCFCSEIPRGWAPLSILLFVEFADGRGGRDKGPLTVSLLQTERLQKMLFTGREREMAFPFPHPGTRAEKYLRALPVT